MSLRAPAAELRLCCCPSALLLLQINAADAILIFDEAHNIEDQARSVLGHDMMCCAGQH
jgi:Rad3-related DNA helicase